MTLVRKINNLQDPTSVMYNAFGELNIAQKKKLFDGKISVAENTLIWEQAGTGTFTYQASSNSIAMSVTAGQYCIRQTKRRIPYFSGSPQFVEITMDAFDTDANTVKRFGAFTSSTVAPHTASYDGYWVENDNGVISMKSANLGTITTTKDFTSWTNYTKLQSYDWSKFTVAVIEYLWLGGAAYKLWLVSPIYGWVLANDNSDQWVGTGVGTICSNPNLPIRYEIRSTTGSGNYTAICSQVSTNNTEFDAGQGSAVFNPTAITCNAVGTNYVLAALRINSSYPNTCTKVSEILAGITASTDSGTLYLVKNPTISAPLTYAANGKIDVAYATNQTITAGTGRIISAKPVGSFSTGGGSFNSDYLSWLSQTITGVADEYVLVYTPSTANQTIIGIFNFKNLD